MLSDWRNFETWQEAGALDATRRANGIWKELLSQYEQPPMDPARREALEAYVAQAQVGNRHRQAVNLCDRLPAMRRFN